jgi:hypothetical protein
VLTPIPSPAERGRRSGRNTRHRQDQRPVHPTALWPTALLNTYLQLIAGHGYLRLPGNVEAFFPLLLGTFVIGSVVAVVAWNAPVQSLPVLPRRVERLTAVLLFVIAAFVPVGLTPGSYVDAVSGEPT